MAKNEFCCPVSPHVAWFWGLIFKDCPVVPQERDSDECRTCPLRGAIELQRDRRPRRDERDRDRKPSGKRRDGSNPNKGKTFVG